jgi:hypothetical protein
VRAADHRGDLRAPAEAEGHAGKLTALLDFQAGVQWEGEDPPSASDLDAVAIRAWNALSNGHGGIEWSGLETVVAWLGIEDVDDLLQRLVTIKCHRPPDENTPPAPEGDDPPEPDED